jgi:hypothetical protein
MVRLILKKMKAQSEGVAFTEASKEILRVFLKQREGTWFVYDYSIRQVMAFVNTYLGHIQDISHYLDGRKTPEN